jgi:hypothetical protein
MKKMDDSFQEQESSSDDQVEREVISLAVTPFCHSTSSSSEESDSSEPDLENLPTKDIYEFQNLFPSDDNTLLSESDPLSVIKDIPSSPLSISQAQNLSQAAKTWTVFSNQSAEAFSILKKNDFSFQYSRESMEITRKSLGITSLFSYFSRKLCSLLYFQE